MSGGQQVVTHLGRGDILRIRRHHLGLGKRGVQESGGVVRDIAIVKTDDHAIVHTVGKDEAGIWTASMRNDGIGGTLSLSASQQWGRIAGGE
jgi:hypothetical protein